MASELLPLNIKILKCFMLWPIDRYSRRVNTFLKLFVHFLLDAVFASPTPAYIINAMKVGAIEDPTSFFESVIATVNWLLYRYICVVFWIKFREIEKLLQDTHLFLQFCEWELISTTEKNIFIFTKRMLVFFSFGLVINLLIPLSDTENCNENRYNELHRRRNLCGAIFSIWLPFDANSPLKYAFAIVSHLIACIHVACGTLAINMYLLGLLTHVIKQLENICTFAESMFSDNNAFSLSKRVTFFAQYHIFIIEYTRRINECFERILVAYIFVPSVVLSVLGYEVLRVDSVSDKVRYIWHITGWCILLFMICFAGQLLTDKSAAVANAVYNSEWYQCHSGEEKKKIVLILNRSQKNLKLTATSFGEMTLQMFVNIVKTAYSYFTLLYTVTEK